MSGPDAMGSTAEAPLGSIRPFYLPVLLSILLMVAGLTSCSPATPIGQPCGDIPANVAAMTVDQLADSVAGAAKPHRCDPASYNQYVTGLGNALGAASRGQSGLPSGYDQQIIDLLDSVPAGTARSNDERPVALSQVLAHGVYDTDFTTTIVGSVIDYWQINRAATAGKTRVAIATGDGGYTWGQRDDPLPGLMTMLANNPAAAQQVFANTPTWNGAPGSTATVDNQPIFVSPRLAWLTSRPWNPKSSDDGVSLGQALETATTTWRDAETTGQTSARIASQLFALTGQNRQAAAALPDPLKIAVAVILANYMPDVYATLFGLPDPDRPGQNLAPDFAEGYALGNPYYDNLPAGAVVTASEFDNLMQAFGSNAAVTAGP